MTEIATALAFGLTTIAIAFLVFRVSGLDERVTEAGEDADAADREAYDARHTAYAASEKVQLLAGSVDAINAALRAVEKESKESSAAVSLLKRDADLLSERVADAERKLQALGVLAKDGDAASQVEALRVKVDGLSRAVETEMADRRKADSHVASGLGTAIDQLANAMRGLLERLDGMQGDPVPLQAFDADGPPTTGSAEPSADAAE